MEQIRIYTLIDIPGSIVLLHFSDIINKEFSPFIRYNADNI